MGSTRSSADAWSGYTRATASSTYGSTFKATAGVAGATEDPQFNPKNITVRESRDSVANPDSTPIILALDGTGSMGAVLVQAFKSLGILFTGIYDRQPVSDPHIMAMIFDDVAVGAPHPLQVSQFESDIIITDQLSKLYVDRNGGGNSSESYHLPLHFAATRTECDAFAKGRKGFLFTIGDEEIPGPLTKEHIKAVYGDDVNEGPYTYRELYDMASENWHVFHIMVEQGSHMRAYKDRTIERWQNEIGQHAIPLSDIDALPEVIIGVMQVVAGEDAAKVAKTFSDSKAVAVAHAVGGLTKFGGGQGGVARL